MGKSIKEKRYKNIERQLIYAEMIEAAKSKDMTVTQYARMCGLPSTFRKEMLDGKRNATEHLLRQLARDIKKTGVKRHWMDYLLPEPEPQVVETDDSAPMDPHEIENLLRRQLCAFGRTIIMAHDMGYKIKPVFQLEKDEGVDDGKQ